MFSQTKRLLKVSSLFTKDENLTMSAPYIGYKILKIVKDSGEEKVSIFDIANNLRKSNNLSVKSIYYGMIFLHSLSLINFDEPYVVLCDEN